MSARIAANCLPHAELVAKIKFGPQAAHAVVKHFQVLGHVFEMPAPDIRPQGGSRTRKVVQRHRDGNAIGRRSNAKFIVGGGHPDGKADDLPGRGQPPHHERKRKRQQLRHLQRGNVERGSHRGNLLLAKNPKKTWNAAVDRLECLPRLQDQSDRMQILNGFRRAYSGERAPLVAA